jgi:ABC-type nitrate/sulfonate/bicarbonate transport system ATPase subunit
MSGPLLELRAVGKSYERRPAPVLASIDLEVAEGEFAAIVGCSGAGKTTLVSLVAGLSSPDRGEIRFADERVVKLTPALHKRPRELSGGMRQRVALARALAMEPRMLVLDEPLSALDALTRRGLQDELARLSRETRAAILMVTNDVDEAIVLADRVHPLTRGPAATLARPIVVALPRPRSRARMSLVPEYQRARREIVECLAHAPGRPPQLARDSEPVLARRRSAAEEATR